MDPALIVGLTSLIAAISAALYQRRKSIIESNKAANELEILEHKMILDIAAKYQALSGPLEKRIKRLEDEISRYLCQIEEKDAENNELKQTVQLQARKIEHLEDNLRQKDAEIRDLQTHASKQSARITELYEMVGPGDGADG